MLKSQYSDEENEAIKKFLQAKRTLRQENIRNGQHKGTSLSGKIILYQSCYDRLLSCCTISNNYN